MSIGDDPVPALRKGLWPGLGDELAHALMRGLEPLGQDLKPPTRRAIQPHHKASIIVTQVMQPTRGATR
jgi:hypothetical protein